MGNPARVLMMDTLTPNVAGDMNHFTSYSHYLQDLKYRAISGDFDFFELKILFSITVELLAFFRMCALLILIRNFLLLLMIAFDTENMVWLFNLEVEEVRMLSILIMVDMLKQTYVVFKPEVLMLDTREALLVFNIPFTAQLLVRTWFGRT